MGKTFNRYILTWIINLYVRLTSDSYQNFHLDKINDKKNYHLDKPQHW